MLFARAVAAGGKLRLGAREPTLSGTVAVEQAQGNGVDPAPPAYAEAIAADIYCPQCAYNLRGSVSDRCPECGYSLTNLRSPECRIPWSRRRERGRFRTYWQTVWMVMFRRRALCEEAARPVSYADAQAFRWATVLHAFVPVVIAVVLAYVIRMPAQPPLMTPFDRMMQFAATGMPPPGQSFADRAIAEVWPAMTLVPCFLLFLAAGSGAPSYFFHPRALSVSQQNRTVALSYYACGPLVLLVLPVFVGALGVVSPNNWPLSLSAPAAIFLLLVVLLMWLVILVGIVRRTMPHLRVRAGLVAFGVPAVWLALGLLTLVCLPSIVLYVLIVVYSLR